MAYIDSAYYQDTYKGVAVGDTATLNRLMERATDIIDQMTRYQVAQNGLSSYAQFIQDQIKKATAAQTEYMAMNGEGVNHGDNFENVSIGKFSYSKGSNKNGGSSRVSPAIVEYLAPTGLLHQGVSVR